MATQVLARCHCGAFMQTLELAHPLPHNAVPCHCNICRSLTGGLYCSSIPLSSPPENTIKAAKLVEFAASAKISRYFCGVCGSYVLIHIKAGPEAAWKVCTGAVDGILGEDGHMKVKGWLERFVGHEFVG